MYPPKKEEKKRIILHISTELELFAAFCALHSLRYEKKKKITVFLGTFFCMHLIALFAWKITATMPGDICTVTAHLHITSISSGITQVPLLPF